MKMFNAFIQIFHNSEELKRLPGYTITIFISFDS